MGVAVSETTMETAIATESVTANSRNRRPTMPPISSRGMNTATSETLMVSTVKPTSCAPFERRLERTHALFQIARDVLDHHDRVVHHKAGGDGQRHQRQIVEAVVQQVHHAEGSDQRHRNGDAGNEGRPRVPQKNENHQDHQDHRDDQGLLGVAHRRADGDGLIHGHLHVDRLRNGGLELRKDGANAVHGVDDVGAGLAEDDDQHGGLAVRIAGIAKVFDGILRLADVGDPHRRSVAVGHHQRRIVAGLEDLIVGAHLPHAVAVGKCPLGVLALALLSTVRTCSRPMPYLFRAGGFSSMRTLGSELPPTITWPTPLTCASFCAMIVEAASYIWPLVRTGEVSASMKIGESAGFTFRYEGLLGRLAGRLPRAALMAACTSRAAASMSRFRSNCSVMLVDPRALDEVISVTAGDASELALERRRHRGGHGLGTGARQTRAHGDGREIHLRQRRDRKQPVSHRSRQRNRDHQERGGDGLAG